MFDSPLCDRPFPEKPFFIEWLNFGWLNKPLLVIIVIFAFFGLCWVVQQKRWRRWLTSKKTILLLFGFTAILPLMFVVAAQVLVVFLATDSGTAAEAIVILGRGALFDEQRVNLAAELWQARRAPMIFTSGRGDAQRMIEQLEAKGIPKQVLDGENCSVSTLENAVFTAAILQKQGIRRIVLITDRPHMLRSLLVFRANGFTVIAHTTPIPPYLGRNLGGRKAKVSLTLREYAGLVNYGLRGLYLPQRSPELNSPELLNLLQKAEQYGQQRRL
jgi:uncharacterized SAM-binding protein YcdF (DUF218 family)